MSALNLIADELAWAHRHRSVTPSAHWHLQSAADSYAVQDRLLERLGSDIGGWKVGAPNATAEPHTAPIPRTCLLTSGNAVTTREPMVEVELALRLAVDLDSVADLPASPMEFATCVDAACTAMESVESRLAEGASSERFAKLADLQSHGALILGAPVQLQYDSLDLRRVSAALLVDDALLLEKLGGNPAQDIWRMLAWLARHCIARGLPLRKGQWVTTGSCTGMTPVQKGARARGKIAGLGHVEAVFR